MHTISDAYTRFYSVCASEDVLLLQIFSWAGTAGTAADLSFSAAAFGAKTGAADASRLATRALAATGGSGDGVLMSPNPTFTVGL